MKNLVKCLYRQIMFWFLQTEFYYFVVKRIIPYIRFTIYYTRFRKFAFARLYSQLKPGDILLSIDYQKLTTKVIGGDWSHAAICVGVGINKTEIVEMTHNDFNETDFHKFCSESERVRIKRVNDTDWDVVRFISNVWKQEDSLYNVGFIAKEKKDPRKNKTLVNKHGHKVHKFNYCSQLVTEADDLNIIKCNWEDLAGLGVPYISPTGLDKATNMITVDDSGLPEGVKLDGQEEKEGIN